MNKVEDVQNETHIILKEQKTGKSKKSSSTKTFGYFHYKKFKDVALLQHLFNHSAPSVTLDYIGVNQDVMDNSMKNFSL